MTRSPSTSTAQTIKLRARYELYFNERKKRAEKEIEDYKAAKIKEIDDEFRKRTMDVGTQIDVKLTENYPSPLVETVKKIANQNMEIYRRFDSVDRELRNVKSLVQSSSTHTDTNPPKSYTSLLSTPLTSALVDNMFPDIDDTNDNAYDLDQHPKTPSTLTSWCTEETVDTERSIESHVLESSPAEELPIEMCTPDNSNTFSSHNTPVTPTIANSSSRKRPYLLGRGKIIPMLTNTTEILKKVYSDNFFASLAGAERGSIIKVVKYGRSDRVVFGKALLDELFTRQQLAGGSCTGSSVKTKLDEQRLAFIKRVIFWAMPMNDIEKETAWKNIQDSFDSKCRGILKNDKKKYK